MIIIDDLKYKIQCYYGVNSLEHLTKILLTDGTSAMFLYRLSKFFLRCRLGVVAAFFRSMNRVINGCWIGRNADFGKGFVIMHSHGIVINSDVRGGDNIVIQSGVVIGVAKQGSPVEIPVLGNNIFIGAGAKLLGGIRIGNNVMIGANAVIVKDVPDNATIVGVPGKVIKIGPTHSYCDSSE